MPADWITEDEGRRANPALASAEAAESAPAQNNEILDQQELLGKLQNRLELALRAGRIGLWEWNASTNSLHWDQRMYQIYGIAQGTLITYELWKKIVHPEDLEAASGIFAPTVQQEKRERHRFRIVHPERGIRWIEASQEMVIDAENNLVACIGCDQDVSEQARPVVSETDNGDAASDKATLHFSPGSQISGSLLITLASEVQRARRYGGQLTVLVAELDNFSEIESQFGTEIGALFLSATAHAMGETIRGTDSLAWNQRNQFSMALPGTTAAEARMLASRIRRRLAQGTVYPLSQPLTASFGIAQWTSSETADALLRRAHQALQIQREVLTRTEKLTGLRDETQTSTAAAPEIYQAANRFTAEGGYCVHCLRPLTGESSQQDALGVTPHLCCEQVQNRKPASPPPYN